MERSDPRATLAGLVRRWSLALTWNCSPGSGGLAGIAGVPRSIAAPASGAGALTATRKQSRRPSTLPFREGHAASDEAWRRVKPFREASAPKIHYLQHAPPRGDAQQGFA